MKPLVSVCIPAYNNAGYIKDTILSVLGQTYQNIELVVVDDCSTDNTVEVLESIEDDRLKIYKNEKNLGMVGNWNRCLELVTGEYVKLICADDLIEKDAIEKEAKAMYRHPSVNLVESDTKLVDINGKKTGEFHRYPKSGVVDGRKLAKKSLILKNFYGAPVNNLIRRSALEKTGGFDTTFTYILDFDMWLRLSCTGDVYIIHEPLNSFRIRNDSNTGVLIGEKRDVYNAEHRRLLEKHAKAGIAKISSADIRMSMMIRKLRNAAIGVYLKIFAK
ncbi:MAG: glycosyltransferase [Lachnospiraceae bacterium]|nr:glycosyltransferase [Lachnospiraceae bacterium]MDD7378623.1 glycosyltransferase [Lachnospiraceae bacterium]MDY4617684.1 glycosyltransferase [Lachnospiraceae bacterium]